MNRLRLRPRFFVALLVGLFFTELAWAHDTRWNMNPPLPSGFHLPSPGIHPWQYGYRSSNIVTYPPVMTVPVVPKAYLEKNARELRQGNWHFYCRNSQAYFPHAQDCAGGWEVVNLQPDLR